MSQATKVPGGFVLAADIRMCKAHAVVLYLLCSFVLCTRAAEVPSCLRWCCCSTQSEGATSMAGSRAGKGSSKQHPSSFAVRHWRP